jgi:TatD DNase family protein
VSTTWPPLDTHAHVDVKISAMDLLELRAVVFAASRNLAESRQAITRQPRDVLTVWGLGVHPGIKTALDSFDSDEFSTLLDRTAYVGEVGLDGKVKSRLTQQRTLLASVLIMLQERPRMTSLHSYGATKELLEELERTPIKGAVLHWWNGDKATTERAVELGAYFSVNAAGLRRGEASNAIPLDRLLLETDHPDGNRASPAPRRPGHLGDVEATLADRYGLTSTALRERTWSNLRRLVDDVGCGHLLPARVGSILKAVNPDGG